MSNLDDNVVIRRKQATRIPIVLGVQQPVKKIVDVKKYSRITIEVYGSTGVEAKVSLGFIGPSGREYPFVGMRVSDMETGTEASVNEVWQLYDLESIDTLDYRDFRFGRQ